MSGYTFSKSAAGRIANAVRRVEMSPGSGAIGPQPHRQRGDTAASIVIGKTTAAWTKGTTANVAVYSGDPMADTGKTVLATNLFADIESGKWVAILGGFLISAEC